MARKDADTMGGEPEFVKAFTQYTRMDYYEVLFKNGIAIEGKNMIDEVMFGNYDAHAEGCEYELAMRWELLQDKTVARLSIYDESFMCFNEHSDLFSALAKLGGGTISPADFCRLLLRLGYSDFSDKKLKNSNKRALKGESA